MGFTLQQDRCRDCGNATRCSDLGNAGNLSRRIPVRLLDIASPNGAAGTFSPVSTARLRALACVLTGYLAHVLARVYWFALPFHSVRDRCLFSDAVAHQQGQGNADDSMKIGTVVLNNLPMESARPRAVRVRAARGRAGSMVELERALSTR